MQIRLPLLFQRPSNSLVFTLFWLPYIAVYQLTNRFPLFEPSELHYSAVDRLVPYVPELMPVYLLYLPLFAWSGIRNRTDEDAARFFYATYFQLAVCATFFVLAPVRMPEGVAAVSSGWAAGFWRWFDGPNNCFPSLHAANGLLFAWFNWNRPARALHVIASLSVVVSTVFVKQHYVVDVVAGSGIFLLTLLFLARVTVGMEGRERRRVGAFAPATE
jgi:membrane-associated phospholipid phosphatase